MSEPVQPKQYPARWHCKPCDYSEVLEPEREPNCWLCGELMTKGPMSSGTAPPIGGSVYTGSYRQHYDLGTIRRTA